MTALKGPVKLVVVIAIFIIVLVVFASLNSVPQNPQTQPTRESAIPAGAVKVTVETDLHPPILYSTDWNQPVQYQVR
jgi:hypothetical protein